MYGQQKGYHTPSYEYLLETIPEGTFTAESKTIYVGSDDAEKIGEFYEAPEGMPIVYTFYKRTMRYFVGEYLVAAYIIAKNDIMGCQVCLIGSNEYMSVEMYKVGDIWYMSRQLGLMTEIYKGTFKEIN